MLFLFGSVLRTKIPDELIGLKLDPSSDSCSSDPAKRSAPLWDRERYEAALTLGFPASPWRFCYKN